MRLGEAGFVPSQAVSLGDGWVKSSRSGNGNACVAVRVDQGVVQVAHSQRLGGVSVTYTGPEWDAFVAGAKAGEFDRQ